MVPSWKTSCNRVHNAGSISMFKPCFLSRRFREDPIPVSQVRFKKLPTTFLTPEIGSLGRLFKRGP